MGILSRAGDLVYTFRFLRLLTTPFNKTMAFELGIIDENGKRDKNVRLDTSDKKAAFTTFHRLVFNMKKVMAKAPGGSSRVASYAAALYLIKEHGDLGDKAIEKILEETQVSPQDIIAEDTKWFQLEDGRLTQGVYRVMIEKLTNDEFPTVINPNDRVKISENCYPSGDILGMNIYEATHMNSGKKTYVTIGELKR